jgi:hypothetical protein
VIYIKKKSQKFFIIIKEILLNDIIISEASPPNSAISIKILIIYSLFLTIYYYDLIRKTIKCLAK